MALFYEAVLGALEEAEVRFVVVGGLAVILHGVPRTTADLDIVIDTSPSNVTAMVDVLQRLGFRPRAPVDAKQLADPETRRAWCTEKGMKAFSFQHPDRPLDAVDVLLELPFTYEELAARAEVVTAGALTLRIAAVRDLIAMKTAAGRAQDRADADALQRLIEAGEEGTEA